MQDALRALSLTLPQYLVLASLVRLDAETGDAVSQRELVDDTGLDKMTTSHAVRALERQGLADRGLDGADTRRWRVIPTRSGIALLKRAAPCAQAASAAFMQPLGGRQSQLSRLLRKLRTRYLGTREALRVFSF
jgi:DNA-binding MarR family transcriptional regulator